MTTVKTTEDLEALVTSNPGIIILKLGATWCAPCKKIEPLVKQWFQQLQHPCISLVTVDIDESINLYGFYKKKRIVRGVPTIMAYYAENEHYIPDDITFGSDEKETNAFFQRCLEYIRENIDVTPSKPVFETPSA